MEAMLGAMATIIGALVAAVIFMWHGRNQRNHQAGNLGSNCEAMAAATKIELALEKGLGPINATQASIATLLEQRPCLGEQMRDALVESLRRRGEG